MVNQYNIRRLRGDSAPFRYDYRFVCKDGTVKWAAMTSSLIMWEGIIGAPRKDKNRSAPTFMVS
ncbi:MAG: hypothetical protein ACYDHG_02075 [Desulfomonilaceae bacterium]